MRPVMSSPNRRWQIVLRHDVGTTAMLRPMIAPIAALLGLFALAIAILLWITRGPPVAPKVSFTGNGFPRRTFIQSPCLARHREAD
jgi:hypothetical protein